MPTEAERICIIEAALSRIEARIDAMDKASDILASSVNQVPTGLDRAKTEITALMVEKLKGVQFQIDGDRKAVEKLEGTFNAKIGNQTLDIAANRKAIENQESAARTRSNMIVTIVALIGVFCALITAWATITNSRGVARNAAEIGVK